MPDFTVIQGGGSGNGGDAEHWRRLAVESFDRLSLELVRSLARGDTGSLSQELFNFIECATKADSPLYPIIDEAVRDVSDAAFGSETYEGRDYHFKEIARACFRYMAECAATDPAAKARMSKKGDSIELLIEEYLLQREERSRANGWSYLDEVKKRARAREKSTKEDLADPVSEARLGAARGRVREVIAAREKPDPTAPPSYEGIARYRPPVSELNALGVRTVDELVERVNALRHAEGAWPLTQDDFPSKKAKFEKLAKLYRQLLKNP